MSYEDLKKPSFMISTTIAIIAVIVSIYLSLSSKKEIDLVYYYDDSAILIYNSMNPSSKIRLLKDSVLVNEDVFISEIVLWNRGDESAAFDKVRDTIKVQFLNCNDILDCKIISESHPTSKFTLNKISFNTVSLVWKYFDPGNAVKFQIIFTGNKTMSMNWKGYIAGIHEIKRVKKFNIYANPSMNDFTDWRFIFSFLIGLLISIPIMIKKSSINVKNVQHIKLKLFSITEVLIIGILSSFAFALILYFIIRMISNETIPL
jgi:hypothetical protein